MPGRSNNTHSSYDMSRRDTGCLTLSPARRTLLLLLLLLLRLRLMLRLLLLLRLRCCC